MVITVRYIIAMAGVNLEEPVTLSSKPPQELPQIAVHHHQRYS
jgi:hypothetical protein